MNKKDIDKPYCFEIFPFTYEVINVNNNEVAVKLISGTFGNLTQYKNKIDSERDIYETIEIPRSIQDHINSTQYNVTEIKPSVFDNLTKVKEIIIPSSIRKIDWGFWDCINLERFSVDENNTKYCDIDGVLYNKERTILIAYPNAKSSKFTVPNGVKKINNKSFKSCCNLRELILPRTISHIGINAFYGCKNLKEVILPDSLQKFEQDGINNENYMPPTIFKYKGKEYKINEISAILDNI